MTRFKPVAAFLLASVAMVGLTGCPHHHRDHYPLPPPPHHDQDHDHDGPPH